MSLILDALRKLEREKDVRDPGVLVVGSVPWGGGRSRRRRALLLAASVVVALAAGSWWLLRRPARAPAGRSPSAPASSPSPTATTPATPIEAGTPTPSPVAPSPRRLDVPGAASAPAIERATRPPTSARPASADDVRLTAISQRDGRPVALINDRLVFEGDSFDGIKVLRIGEAEVEIESGGKRRVLRF